MGRDGGPSLCMEEENVAQSRTRKMVNLDIEETSGVDYPAHLHDGWLVMKAADPDDVQRVLDSTLTKEESVSDMTTEERLAEAQEALAKAEARIAELEAEAPADAPAEEPDDILKSAPEAVVKMVEELRKAAETAEAAKADAEEALRKSREEAADAAAIEQVSAWENLSLDAETVGKSLRRVADIDAELAKAITGALESVNAQAESANIFAEIGKSSSYTSGSAVSQMTAMAKSAVEAGVAPTFEQAFAKAASENPDLYAQYLTEKGA